MSIDKAIRADIVSNNARGTADTGEADCGDIDEIATAHAIGFDRCSAILIHRDLFCHVANLTLKLLKS